MAVSVALQSPRLENGVQYRSLAWELAEEAAARDQAEVDSNLEIVRALLRRNEALKLRIRDARTLAGQIEAQGTQKRRAA